MRVVQKVLRLVNIYCRKSIKYTLLTHDSSPAIMSFIKSELSQDCSNKLELALLTDAIQIFHQIKMIRCVAAFVGPFSCTLEHVQTRRNHESTLEHKSSLHTFCTDLDEHFFS